MRKQEQGESRQTFSGPNKHNCKREMSMGSSDPHIWPFVGGYGTRKSERVWICRSGWTGLIMGDDLLLEEWAGRSAPMQRRDTARLVDEERGEKAVLEQIRRRGQKGEPAEQLGTPPLAKLGRRLSQAAIQ